MLRRRGWCVCAAAMPEVWQEGYIFSLRQQPEGISSGLMAGACSDGALRVRNGAALPMSPTRRVFFLALSGLATTSWHGSRRHRQSGASDACRTPWWCGSGTEYPGRQVWTAGSGQLEALWGARVHGGMASSCTFSADGLQLASASKDGHVVVLVHAFTCFQLCRKLIVYAVHHTQ